MNVHRALALPTVAVGVDIETHGPACLTTGEDKNGKWHDVWCWLFVWWKKEVESEFHFEHFSTTRSVADLHRREMRVKR
jgi:hypothetical protein